jgi:uncharacterized phage protein gp47/JayE
MAIVAKSLDDVLSDLSDYLVEEGSKVILDRDRLNDFNQGAKLKIFTRAVGRAVSDCWRSLSEVERDASIASATEESLDLLVSTFGLSRKLGSTAVGFMIAIPNSVGVTATLNTGDVFTVNNGTLVVMDSRIIAGPYAIVPIQSVNPGVNWNLTAGTALKAARTSLNSSFKFFVGSSLSVLGVPQGGMSGGEDQELDDDLRARFADYIQSLVKATFKAVSQAVRSVAGVRSVSIVEYFPQIGFFSCYIDDGSANPTVSTGLISAVEAVLFETRAAGVGVKVRAMEKNTADVELEVTINRSVVPATVEAEIIANLTAALNNYSLGQPLFTSKLSDIAHNTDGVIGVKVVKPTGLKYEIEPQQVFRPRSIVVNARL